MITLEDAVSKAKDFLMKMKGLDIEFAGRKLIDWLDFDASKEEETLEYYCLIINLIENMFSKNRVKYKIQVNKETGNVDDFKKIYEE